MMTVALLLLALVPGIAGCGTKQGDMDNKSAGAEAASVAAADADTTAADAGQADSIPGIWQTASMAYEDDSTMYPEHYVRFTDTEAQYGHLKDGKFDVEYTHRIEEFETLPDGGYRVKLESDIGVQYTYQTAESDPDVLEYYDTWNEADFPTMYRGGASLSRYE